MHLSCCVMTCPTVGCLGLQIADFGLSRVLEDDMTQVLTSRHGERDTHLPCPVYTLALQDSCAYVTVRQQAVRSSKGMREHI